MATQRFFERYRLLNDASDRLRGAGDLDAMLEILRQQARAIAHADGVAVIQREDDHVFYVGEDAMAPLWAGQRFPIRYCLSGMAMLAGTPVIVPDIAADPRVPLGLYLQTFVRSVAVFPVGAPPVAALALYWREAQPLGRDVEFLISMLAQNANATLQGLALRADATRQAIAA